MAGHDLGYKYLFAHPELVRDLLADFTQFSFLGALAPAAFERVNPSHVSERFSERHDDILWRARLGDRWLYVYILLEFQSGVDRWMALRMQVYIGLLYQDLIKGKQVAPGALLPPVLPLVFYNGAAAWTAAPDLSALIMSGPDTLAPFQATQRYVLIDQQRLDAEELAAKRSVLALLFRLELSDVPEVLKEVLPALGTWLRMDAQAPLRRSVAAWVEQLLVRQFKEIASTAVFDFEGESDMGARKFETWADYLEDKGRQQGIELGVQQGMKEGLQQGMRTALQSVLVKRFGAIPVGMLPTLEQAGADELGKWLVQALDTPSIEALLSRPASR